MTKLEVRELSSEEIRTVAGGPIFVPLIPIAVAAFGAGYVWGSDRAHRDNARDAQNEQSQD